MPRLQLQFVPFAITPGRRRERHVHVQPAKDEGLLSSSTFLHPRARGRDHAAQCRPGGPAPDRAPAARRSGRTSATCWTGCGPSTRSWPNRPWPRSPPASFEPEASCRTEPTGRAMPAPTAHPPTTRSARARWASMTRAVVDPELRGHGLRASGWWTPRSCGRSPPATRTPVDVIGERAAAFILQQGCVPGTMLVALDSGPGAHRGHRSSAR